MLISHYARRILLVPAIAVVAIGLVAAESRAGVPQDAHRAFYTIGLGRLTGAASVVGVKGAMTSEWERSCDGWTGTQKLSVTMERAEGTAMVSEVAASIFETHDATRLRFTSKTTVDDEVVEQVRGRAERSSRDAPGRAYYLEPPNLTIDLPAGTLFPFQHTLAIVDAATSGTGHDYSPFFDGAQPEHSPLMVNTLVLGPARPAAAGPGATLGPLTAHRWWPVRLAFFAHGEGAGEPEIEMTQYVQDNGVVRRFDFDYGEFTIVATLVRVEPIAPPSCN
jgi:hypothetical protein